VPRCWKGTGALCEGLSGRFCFKPCNVRDTAAIETSVQHVGEAQGIDLLVNKTQAASSLYLLPGSSAAAGTRCSVFTVTKAAYPFLKARRGSVASISLSDVDRIATHIRQCERWSQPIRFGIMARPGVQATFH
jgi:citronellol/citronellal dehydrogenase